MFVTLEEAKNFLRIDGNDDDELITTLIGTSESLCKSITRRRFLKIGSVPEPFKTAVLYAVTYLYENRENANFKELIDTLRFLLSDIRRVVF